MKGKHTYGKTMARNGPTTVIYKGTFVSNHSLTCIVNASLFKTSRPSKENSVKKICIFLENEKCIGGCWEKKIFAGSCE